ncbi:MAG: lipoprotein insertase outer membrane protein LolB [bacterium]
MIDRMYRQPYLVAVILATGLSACSSVPDHTIKAAKPANAEQAWAQRQAKFDRMKSWRLQGRVGVRHQAQSWTFSIVWLQQNGKQYAMNIKNPLTGNIVAQLTSTEQGVSLLANDGKTYRDADAEQLLRQQMGVGLPLKGMKYWVRGLISPDYLQTKNAIKLDAYGRPIQLQQAGWMVKYTKYESDTPYALPEKMNLSHRVEKTRVKVVAKDWQTRY